MPTSIVPRTPLLVIVGPTGSGKSDLALDVAEATGGEIVNADSVQIYREFDIGSGKPSSDALARVPHHLLGTCHPLQPMDAARFSALAARSIEHIVERGRRPIVCGGSFLWVRALLYGLAPAPPADEALRARHRELVRREGAERLHADLMRIDESSAHKLNPNDVLRVSRALEVFELTQRPLSAWHAEHGFRTPRYDVDLVGIRYTPAELVERLRARTRRMLEAGLVDEVRALLEKGYADARAMAAVGYRDVRTALASGLPIDLPALEDQIVRRTHVFARRQRTWLKGEAVRWLEPGEAERVLTC